MVEYLYGQFYFLSLLSLLLLPFTQKTNQIEFTPPNHGGDFIDSPLTKC